MPRLITLFEHSEAAFDWSERDLAAIDQLNRRAGADVLRAATRGVRKTLQARQYVGVVRLGQQSIQILPKLYRTDESRDERTRAREATRNLLRMLAYASRLPLREQAIVPLLQRELDWFEILTRLFATHLAEEWQCGAHHAYQEVEADLPALKGKWRLVEHLRHPGPQMHLPVAYAEFSADNSLSRVFRYVVEQLWRQTRDDDNRRCLANLRAWMGEVPLLPLVTAAGANPGLITRLNRRYEPLLNLARVFLSHGALQLAAGEVATFGLVLDMNRLFQEFVVNIILRHRAEVLPPALQACELLPQSHGAVQHLARRSSGDAVFPLYPDLAFRSSVRFPLLMDAKYKALDPASKRLGVAQDDFYQMFTYAHRYHCPRVLMLYPQLENAAPIRQSFRVQSAPSSIDVATIDLARSLNTGLQAFLSELKAILTNE